MPKIFFTLYAILLAIIFAGIVVHAPLTIWLGTVVDSLLVKAWKEILMLALLLPAIWIAVRSQLFWLRRDILFVCIIAYAVLHLLLVAVFRPDLPVLLAGLAIDLRYLLFFVLVYVAVMVQPAWRRHFLIVGGGMAVFSLLFAVLQVFVLPRDILASIGYGKATIAPFLTVDNNPDYVRINGTFRGPNPLGAYGVVVMSLVVAVWLRLRRVLSTSWRWVVAIFLLVSSVLTIYVSYARSALMAALVALGSLAVAVYGQRLLKKRSVAVVAVVCIVAVAGLFAARDTSLVQHVILHEDPQGKSQLSSNEGHFQSLVEGTQKLLTQPFGAGPGSTGSASLFSDQPLIIEHQYLFVAHETGWLGLGLFVVIFGLIMQRLWRARADWLALGTFASGAGLAVIGLFLPVWVDDSIGIVWWGLAAIALASNASKTKHKGGKHGRKPTN